MIMVKEIQYKKALGNILYYQAVGMSRQALQSVSFYDEETTDDWTLERCRISYVKDQLKFIEDGNLDDDIEETWNMIFRKENA